MESARCLADFHSGSFNGPPRFLDFRPPAVFTGVCLKQNCAPNDQTILRGCEALKGDPNEDRNFKWGWVVSSVTLCRAFLAHRRGWLHLGLTSWFAASRGLRTLCKM